MLIGVLRVHFTRLESGAQGEGFSPVLLLQLTSHRLHSLLGSQIVTGHYVAQAGLEL